MATGTTSKIRCCLFIAFASAILLTAGSARAAVELFDFGINLDGTTSCNFGSCDTNGLGNLSSVAGVDDSAFDFFTGLGSIAVSVTGTGAHNVDLFLDHELDDAINGFFNEIGAVGGTPAAGQSWEIDEPQFVTGDIFTNFLSSTLDNGIGTGGSGTTFPDDVAMAIGFDFTLAAGEYATISYLVSRVQPSGFF